MKKHTVAELDELYADAEKMDKAHYAEQRTNILLYFGEHYKAKANKFIDRNKDIAQETKLKLQENHIQRVCNRYEANIINQAPGVTCVPYNESELADQKDAELTLAVIRDGEEKLKFDEILAKLVNSFVVTGEMMAFLYWNPYKGKLIGYEQERDEAGNLLFSHPLLGTTTEQVDPLTGAALQPKQSDKPVFEGEIVADVVAPYNVKRHKSAETLSESPFICIDKMVSQSEAKLLMQNQPDSEEKLKAITSSSNDSFKVFEASVGEYIDSQGQVLLKYWLFRPCYDYPNGYFYIQCGSEVLVENELPFGIWSFCSAGFRSVQGTPRSRSIVKDLRHPQVELNRLVSQQAYHTMALGDDKVFTQMGSKVTKGATWSGIREFQINGPPPTVLPGRDGSQFEAAIARVTQTFYQLADLESEMQNVPAQQDPWAMLFNKLTQKQKLSPYANKVQSFLVDFWSIYVRLAKKYYTDDRVIKSVGRREAINLAEFKNLREDGYRIKVKPMNTDIESMFGKSLQLQQVLQYAGKDLPNNVKARLVRMMPFMNQEQIMDELLIDDENIDSDILALDRGEYRPALKSDNHEAYIKRLVHRTKQGDFRLLNPQVQQMYQAKISEHEQMQAQVVQELKAAQADFIPSAGAMVKVDVYNSEGKRVTLPYDAIQWLVQHLEKQGQTQKSLDALGQQQQVDVLKMAQGMSQQPGMDMMAGMQSPGPMPPIG